MSLILAILALGLLIVLHEAGHLTVARLSKMRVERFSIGFGPALVKWTSGGTIFQIAPVPFGGFVQITGMNPNEEYDPADANVYPNRPTWMRFLTILAGPATNYLGAIVMIFAVFAVAGIDTGRADQMVRTVLPGKPAAGKLEPGDKLVSVNGRPVLALRDPKPADPVDFRTAVQQAEGKPLRVGVVRRGQPVEVELTPKFEPPVAGEKPVWQVGIQMEFVPIRRSVGVATAAGHAAWYPVDKSREILVSLYKIVRREVPGDVVGPVGITAAIREQVRRGWTDAFELLALLSVYLGLFNLLPLPALDGGRLAFLGYELATRRRPNPRVEAIVHTVGFVVLALLMVVVVFKDIRGLL